MGKLLKQLADVACPIAVSVTDETPTSLIEQALDQGADILEWRLDLFADVSVDHVLQSVQRFAHIPSIVTMRIAREGGEWRASDEARHTLYSALMPHVSAIDVELQCDELHAQLKPACAEAGVSLILSHHNFEQTPAQANLEATLAKGIQAQADIVKIAAQVNVPEDNQRLARCLLSSPKQAKVLIGMSALGCCTRTFFPALGSAFTFAHLGAASAPGQLPLDELLQARAQYYG